MCTVCVGSRFNSSHGPGRRIRLRKSNYVKIIPTYMMIREIISGRQQRVRRCPLQNVVAGTLISSVKVSVALTSAEVIDLAGSVD